MQAGIKKVGTKKKKLLALKIKKASRKMYNLLCSRLFFPLLFHSSNLPASSFGEVLLILKIGQVKNCSCVLC